jgi:hypothetical protein
MFAITNVASPLRRTQKSRPEQLRRQVHALGPREERGIRRRSRTRRTGRRFSSYRLGKTKETVGIYEIFIIVNFVNHCPAVAFPTRRGIYLALRVGG